MCGNAGVHRNTDATLMIQTIVDYVLAKLKVTFAKQQYCCNVPYFNWV